MATTQQAKRKCRQYSMEYLKYGFVSAPHSQQQPMCLLCKKMLSNEAMEPSRLFEHLTKMHSDKADKISIFLVTSRKVSEMENDWKYVC